MPRTTLQPGERIRILVCDDSVVMRRIIVRILEPDPRLEVVGIARNGVEALQRIEQLRPHVVTLDVEMPELDGLGALREIVAHYPAVCVLMLSALTARGAQVTVEALIAGASDYVTKPLVQSDTSTLTAELLGKLHGIFTLPSKFPQPLPQPPARPALKPPPTPAAPRVPPPRTPLSRAEVFCIGTSTGGPAALAVALPMLPADFPLPVLIVQHMPANFTGLLAAQLARRCLLPVAEATDGMPAAPGTILLAPGDRHMRLVRTASGLAVRLDSEPQENFCRPAVDVLFRSVAETCRGRAIAAILTGMGQDGLLGARRLAALGAPILAQDRASSVIWGMPGVVANAGIDARVLPLESIVPRVLALLGRLPSIPAGTIPASTRPDRRHPNPARRMNPITSLAAAAVSGPPSSSLAPPAPPPLSNTGFTFLQVFIQRHSGIVVGSDKRYLVEARLQPVLARAGIASLDTLCARLAATPPPAALVQSVIDAMTTNETFFFRDPAVFEALRTAALPNLFAAIPASAARPLRIWSAASSTGQEPYSLAMLLHLSREEAVNATLPPRPPVLRRLIPRLPALRSAVSHPALPSPPVPSPPVPRPVEILGTDLSAAALIRAREGRYRQFEVMRGLPAALLSRFFTRQPAAAAHTPTHGQGHTPTPQPTASLTVPTGRSFPPSATPSASSSSTSAAISPRSAASTSSSAATSCSISTAPPAARSSPTSAAPSTLPAS